MAKGFSQRPGLDYNEIFCPLAHGESFRVIVAVAAQHQRHLRQIDTVEAFLNGKSEENRIVYATTRRFSETRYTTISLQA